MNVSLTTELEELVEAKVSTGRYKSASEVVREALRLLEERDQLHAVKLDEIRAQIAEGIAQVEAGQVVDGPEAVERVRKRIAAEKKARKTEAN